MNLLKELVMKRQLVAVLALLVIISAAGLLMSCKVQQVSAGGIEGTVTDTDGTPLIGLAVWIVDGTTAFPEIAVLTNKEGYYRIRTVPPGTFEVAVHDRKGSRIGLESVLVRRGRVSTLNFVIPVEERPEGALTVAELLENPVYDTEVRIYGQVSLLGELFCPCFQLTSGGKKVMVWYDLMVEDGGTARPAVSVEGVQNGDHVIVTGELKTAGIHRSLNDFWASGIEKVDFLARKGDFQ